MANSKVGERLGGWVRQAERIKRRRNEKKGGTREQAEDDARGHSPSYPSQPQSKSKSKIYIREEESPKAIGSWDNLTLEKLVRSQGQAFMIKKTNKNQPTTRSLYYDSLCLFLKVFWMFIRRKLYLPRTH